MTGYCGDPACPNVNYHHHTRPSDPAYVLLLDGHTSTPEVFRANCYICTDPEFAQMGMPLCKLCEVCKTGHVPADDEECDDCGANAREIWEAAQYAEYLKDQNTIDGEVVNERPIGPAAVRHPEHRE